MVGGMYWCLIQGNQGPVHDDDSRQDGDADQQCVTQSFQSLGLVSVGSGQRDEKDGRQRECRYVEVHAAECVR